MGSQTKQMRKDDRVKSGPSQGPSVAVQEDRRHSGRHMISTVAQVVELGSGASVNTRVSDLGLGGCYLDTMTPLPVGAEVRLGLLKDKKVIEVNGRIIYSHPGLGMGVSFSDATPQQRFEIDQWVAELDQIRTAPVAMDTMPNQPSRATADGRLLLKLIHLLAAKGVLGEDEVRDLLNKPLL